MLRALIGDMFQSEADTLVNTVNCVGIMGKGVAQAFKERFPKMFEDYRDRCNRGLVRLGQPYLYRDLSGVSVINFPTKDHWRSSSRIGDVERGLTYLREHLNEWGVTSLALPPLGCGNGGLEWSEVGPLIYRKLHDLPIDMELYAPYGTPKTELTEEFLSGSSQMSLEGKGRRPDKFNPNWVALMEVIRGLSQQRFANPIGRTIFQKVCYVLTEMGVSTGFIFEKGAYGPFSEDVQKALHVLANKNWVQEQTLGRMVALKPTPLYERERGTFAEVVREHERRIDKTIDLFSRIKSTDQAEVMATVLFSARQLKASKRNEVISEQDLFDFIVDWKQAWRRDEKQMALAEAIRNLVVLGWVKLEPSALLAVTEDDDFDAALG